MIITEFASRAVKILAADDTVIGLAVGGSWLTNEMDEFSDLDLILLTREKVSGNKEAMLDYARQLGNFLSGFTGEHVGEPRVLICLYDDPLLHVDIKFLTLDELNSRVENPVLLLDKTGQLQTILNASIAQFPYPDYQWIEDRFWTWIHYALLKTGRGEYLEAFDFLGFLRMTVLGPLLQIRNGKLPRGVRKVETELEPDDLNLLTATIPQYNRASLLTALHHAVSLYRQLRLALFNDQVVLHQATEAAVMNYFTAIENNNP